jgi:hypothetical protein
VLDAVYDIVRHHLDGRYIHNDLIRSTGWVLDIVYDLLRELKRYPDYTLTYCSSYLVIFLFFDRTYI